MLKPYRPFRVALALALLLSATLAAAQETGQPIQPGNPPVSSSFDRLYLSFIEDATLVDQQWWEGRLQYANSSSIDVVGIGGVIAIQPWKDVEVGGRMGFAKSDTRAPLPDGRGATDLDLWGKYYFGSTGKAQFSAGGILTVPTGDDSAGLGYDAFSLGAFGAMRHRIGRSIVLAVNAGFQLNEDGKYLGQKVNGETAGFIGVGVVLPLSDPVTFIGEVRWASERFEPKDPTTFPSATSPDRAFPGLDDDGRVLAGVNLRLGVRGMFRGAVGLGFTDGAPDFDITLGYAAQF